MKNEFLIRKLERSLQDNPNNVQAHYELGRLYEEDGELQHAVRELERAVNLNPLHAASRFELGIVYTRMKAHELAIKEWQKLVDEDGDLALDRIDYTRQATMMAVQSSWERYREENPPNVFVYFNIAFAYFVLGRVDEAALEFERVLSINERFENANYYLGLIWQKRGQDARSVESFLRELEGRPHSPQVYYALAVSLHRQAKSSHAILHLQKAIQLKPRYVKAQFRLGLVYAAQGQMDFAVTHFEKAIEFQPDFYDAHFELAQSYEKQFKMDQAITEYQRAVQSNPRRKEAHFQLGLLYKNYGKLQQALEQLEASVDIDPLDGDAYYYMGLIRYQLGKYEESAADYERALQAIPNHAYAHYSLGQAYMKLGQNNEAIAEFRRALEMNPRDAQARNALGMVLFGVGDLESAVQEFEKVLEQNPRDAQAHYFYGAALFKMQRVDQAIEEYSRVATLNPNSVYAHFSLGASLSRKGEYERAVQEYMKATQTAPTNDQDLALFATLQLLAAIGVEHAQQAHQLRDMFKQLESVYINTVKALTNAIDARDTYTRFHSSRVSKVARRFAEHLGYKDDNLTAIEMGGYMHDVGKIGVPDFVLQKEGKLTEAERMIMEEHPVIGAEIIENIMLPWKILPIVRGHHERWNGSGYPDGLKGNAIPREAQIVSISDFFDALSTARAYKPAYPPAKCIEEMKKVAGIHFDPLLVERFVPFVDELILVL
ncbi:MAG: tetratricopeptide repeat protein [Armatimonadetes bacterium]|nr:tetratricopeptide repeat protein [Armatimonadota bacterium]